MKVHIILHHWCHPEEEGQDICGAFKARDSAVRIMRKMADEEKTGVKDDWGKEFDPDFCNDDDLYISYGWYASGLGVDSSWSWSIESMEVQ